MKFKSPIPFFVSILSIIGIFFISISSQTEASLTVGDKFFFIRKQITWLIIGMIVFYFSSKIKIAIVKKYSFLLYLITNILLLVVLFPQLGTEALGAKRWLNLGPFGIQPSEIAKMVIVLFFPLLFSDPAKKNLKTLLIYLGIPFILIILEPNLSTAVLLSAISLVIYYLSEASISSIINFSLISISIFALLTFSAPYRFTRLKTLLNNKSNTTSSSYHSNQIIYALASGGIWGKGFANSDQKYKYLPKISTDSILAIIGEETGFIGIVFIMYCYLYLIAYIFKIAAKIEDSYESLLISGVGAWLAFQTLINVGAIANVIPLTGIPLPFISYGGSSLVSLFFVLGLVYNIEKKNHNLLYSKNDQENHYYRNSPHTRARTHKTIARR